MNTYSVPLLDDTFKRTAFLDFNKMCLDYITDVESIAECDKYMKELSEVMHFEHLNGFVHAIKKLSQTDIFHKAVGEVVEFGERSLKIKNN